MKELIEYILEAKEYHSSNDYINEAAVGTDNKQFFKDFKKLFKIGAYGEKWYNVVDEWVERYGLTLLDERKLEKPTNQPMLTMLLSKKSEHTVLDIAVTRPGKKYELEGLGTINLIESTYISTTAQYDKWIKGYRGITKLQFAFPHGFFDNIRAYLGDKLV